MNGLGDRPLRLRLSTRDQAAECYRRWTEEDVRVKEFGNAWTHVARAAEILLTSLKAGEFDHRLAERFGAVVDEAMFVCVRFRSEDRACEILRWVESCKDRFNKEKVELVNIDRFLNTYNTSLEITTSISRLPLASARAGTESGQPDGTDRRLGRVRDLVSAAEYGYILDNVDGGVWFFHRNHLQVFSDWLKLRGGVRVSFTVGANRKGACAVDVRLEEVPELTETEQS